VGTHLKHKPTQALRYIANVLAVDGNDLNGGTPIILAQAAPRCMDPSTLSTVKIHSG